MDTYASSFRPIPRYPDNRSVAPLLISDLIQPNPLQWKSISHILSF
jgi:hypothetical protein